MTTPALSALLADLVHVERWAPGSPYYRGRAGVNLATAITSASTAEDWAIEDRAVVEIILRRHPEALRELLGGQALPNPPHWHRCTRGDEHDFECNDSSCYVWDSGNQGHDFEGYPQPCLAHAAAKEPT
jgi:hypothetical protein